MLNVSSKYSFNCPPHEITNSKITFYGFSLNALRLINSYLSYREKGQKSMKAIAPGKNIYLEYLKDLFYALFFSTSFCMVYLS